jgi:hypothetical protein
MYDNVTRIDQDPVAMRQAFHAKFAVSAVFQRLSQLLRARADRPVRAPGRNDHVIAYRRLSMQVDRHHIFVFCVGKGVEHSR